MKCDCCKAETQTVFEISVIGLIKWVCPTCYLKLTGNSKEIM